MSVCLCNLSADFLLESLAQEKQEVEPVEPNVSFFQSDPLALNAALGQYADKLPYPIELLVDTPKNRRMTARMASHVWRGTIPRGSFLKVSDDLYVTSPEFTLMQQACQLHQANLCQMLGRYLGTWSPTGEGPVKRAPLVTLEELNDFVIGAGKSRGVNNLRLAMAYTCENAASAPESTLQLILSLPPELHGFSLPTPILNYEVELSATAKALCDKSSIRIDVCWPQKQFGLEYQGKGHEMTLDEDCARWYAARSEGYELWYVANGQLNDPKQMDYIGREVAKRLGVRINEKLWPSESELNDLLDTLAGRSNPKPIPFRELQKRRVEIGRVLRGYA